jgi:RluA family pseudouridine synthase
MDIKPEDLVLFSDEQVLAINKPSGLLTLPHGYDPTQPHVKSVLEPTWGTLWIVHRLDRATSGILLLARSKEAHKELNNQFQEGQVKKIYHALVVGSPPWEEVRVDLPLRPDGDRKHRTIVDHTSGKASLTHFRVLRRFSALSLLESRPETGRTHQIRAHLKALKHPIVSDSLYGERDHPSHVLLPRLGLHALSISLSHPASEEKLNLEAPYHEDFQQALSKARG